MKLNMKKALNIVQIKMELKEREPKKVWMKVPNKKVKVKVKCMRDNKLEI